MQVLTTAPPSPHRYAGYVDGLNSLHVMYANDGAIADSSGVEPPPFRWQPKMNFDISI